MNGLNQLKYLADVLIRVRHLPAEMRWSTPARTSSAKAPLTDCWERPSSAAVLDDSYTAPPLCEEHPGRYEPGQLRTLQQRIRRWAPSAR